VPTSKTRDGKSPKKIFFWDLKSPKLMYFVNFLRNNAKKFEMTFFYVFLFLIIDIYSAFLDKFPVIKNAYPSFSLH
jgi:hypothetical protein